MMCHRLPIPGNFPDPRLLCIDAAIAVLFGYEGIRMTTVDGLGPEYEFIGVVMGLIVCLSTYLMGIWDLGESLLIGYGVYFRRVRKVDIVRVDYGWTPVAPFGKQLCLFTQDARLIVIPGGQLRNLPANLRTVKLFSSVLPGVRTPNLTSPAR